MGQASFERMPLNAPGPFFVLKDQCIACLAPEAEAPELMAFDEHHGSCYFHRQPATSEELSHAIAAVAVACCDAVRYDGADPAVLMRIAEYRVG